MNTPDPRRIIRVAVLGNPNTGKSTLFNALTGIHQHTGNYPGVTVENRTGILQVQDTQFELVDLPGTYSLTPRSPDEMVTVNVLLGESPADAPPDMILCVVDASNLQRNLFLVSQILDLGKPTVIAANMTDVAQRQGLEHDLDLLSTLIGVPVVGIQAKKQLGFGQLKEALVDTVGVPPKIQHRGLSDSINQSLDQIVDLLPEADRRNRFAVTRMLFDSAGLMTRQWQDRHQPALVAAIEREKKKLESEGLNLAELESRSRYDWAKQQLAEVSRQGTPQWGASLTHHLDRVLTHPVLGLIVALVVLVIAFQGVFYIADPASSLIDWFALVLSGVVDWAVPSGAFHSLLNDGLINGVGGVLVFLPQILLLFFILAVLEDSGYLARLAFLMDKYLSRIGLSGITLFPLLSSFACAIPGIMATRVIKNERERLITILVAPLMSCSARLPVYVLLIVVFVPDTRYLGGWLGLQGLTMFAMYAIGIVTGIAVAWLLKKTILKTGSSTFVLELPSYKLPTLHNIGRRMFDGGWAFVRDAGTMIVAVTILVWAAGYFPRGENRLPEDLIAKRVAIEAIQSAADENLPQHAQEELDRLQAQLDNQTQAFQLKQSYLGRAGQWIEPAVRPLGWDWRIGSAAIASFPAREVVVSTMGVIFGLGEDTNEKSTSLRDQLRTATWDDSGKKLFSLPVALSIMVFFALCAQCVSTLAVMKRETNSWWWPTFTFVYMTGLAYLGALITFQIADRLC